jgi:hypothetical protein
MFLLDAILWAMMLVPVIGTGYLAYGAIRVRKLEYDVTSLEVTALLNTIDHRLSHWEAPLLIRLGAHETRAEATFEMPMQQVIPPIPVENPMASRPWKMEDHFPQQENYSFARQHSDYSDVIF